VIATVRRANGAQLVVAIGLAMAPVIALGFSRFAYALLLPPMKSDLGWSYTQAGSINTANALGYIAGAITAAWAARALTSGRAFVASLSLATLILLATGLTSSFEVLLTIRTLGGYATAVAFVIGSALAARLSPSLLPVYFAGPGVGIVLASIAVPTTLAAGGSNGWKVGWIALGAVSVVGAIAAWRAEAHVPEHQGRSAASLSVSQFRNLAPMFAAYVLFGAGYVSFMTFVIEALSDHGVGSWTRAAIFVALGLSSAIATFIWGGRFGALTGGRGLAVVSIITLVGTLPLLASATVVTAAISAVIFGSSFMSGPTAVTAFCRRCLPTEAWAAGIALMTTGFAVGQAVGPVASGFISDHMSQGVTAGLWISPILLLLAAVLAFAQRPTDADTALLDLEPLERAA
jgi:predicted MFS family arabinose efflux permease